MSKTAGNDCSKAPKPAADRLIIASSAVMQPAIALMALRTPERALTLITYNMLGPGVADTTNVINTNNHQVLRFITRHSMLY